MVKDLNDPTNRDTIPAMLTEGEYVVNKEATNMFGPIIHEMNNLGLAQREAENKLLKANIGGKISKLYKEGYTAPGQAYAIAKSMGYNTGGLVNFLKKHEGWRDKAYQDSAGVWTIGYGRTRNPDGSPIRPDQRTSKEAEDQWIEQRAGQDYAAVKNWADSTGENYSPKEIEALASFRYNLGPGGFKQLTGDGRRSKEEIKTKLPLYNKAGGQVIEGLNNRRSGELAHAGWGEDPRVEREVAEIQSAPPQETQPNIQQPQSPAAQVISTATGIPTNDVVGGLAKMGLQSFLGGSGPAGPMPMPQVQGGRTMAYEDPRQWLMQGRNLGGPVHMNLGGWIKDLLGLGEQAGLPDPVPQDLPPVPGSDESFLQGSSQSIEEMERISQLPIGHPERVASIESGAFQPTEGDLNWEEQQWRTGEALQRAQMQAAVTAPDAPGAEFIQNRVNALEMQADSLGAPPPSTGGYGVGADVNVSNDPSVQLGSVPGLPMNPNAVGSANPVYDNTTPSAEQVIMNQPQDIWGGMDSIMAAPGMEDQAALQQMATGAPDQPPVPSQIPEGLVGSGPGEVPVIDTASATLQEDPDARDPRIGVPDRQPSKRKAAVAEVVNNIGEEPLSTEEATTAEQAGRNAPPAKIEEAKGFLQETFGHLFDKKELARAAVLFAGAMVTGMPPNRALAFAGTNYMNRLDAKEARIIKNQEDAAKAARTAASKNQPTIDMTQSEDFFVDGVKVKGFKLTKYGPNGEKIIQYVDKNSDPIPLNAHQDASKVEGEPEYDSRVVEQSKLYSDVFSGLQERFGKTDDGYMTGLTKDKVGTNTAKWAIKNNVPPDAMGQLIDNAYQQALSESREGKQVRNIEAYLNDQYVRSQVGDPSLFMIGDKGDTADSDKVNALFSTISSAAKQDPNFAGMSQTAISSAVMQIYRPKWGQLSDADRKSYNRRAGKGESGFMVYLRDQL